MKHGMGLGLTVVACGVVAAAEPPARTATPSVMPARAASAPSPKPVVPATAAAAKPLDLRIGDVRKYMMPREFQAALGAPEADANTVVVEGQRELLRMKSLQPVPGGIIAPFWAIAHPTQAWKLLVPDMNAPPDGPPVDKVPPPIFRWGP